METFGWLLFIIPLFFLIVGLISSFARWLGSSHSFVKRCFVWLGWLVAIAIFWMVGVWLISGVPVQYLILFMLIPIFSNAVMPHEKDRR